MIQIRPDDLASAAWDNEERIHELRESKERRGELPMNFPSFHMEWNEIRPALSQQATQLDILYWGAGNLVYDDIHTMPFGSPPTFIGRVENFVQDAAELINDGTRIVAVTSHSRRLEEILSQNAVPCALSRVTGFSSGAGDAVPGAIVRPELRRWLRARCSWWKADRTGRHGDIRRNQAASYCQAQPWELGRLSIGDLSWRLRRSRRAWCGQVRRRRQAVQ